MPFGNGLDSTYVGVRPPSFDASNVVDWLNPLVKAWPVGLRKYLPYPARTTVFSLIWEAAPARGCQLFQSNFHGVVGAPLTSRNWMPPLTGWPTTAEIGFEMFGSKA